METLRAADFDGRRLKRPGLWAVSFAADWCPFCREFRPHFDAFRPPAGAHTALGDLTDLDNPLWETFDIEVVPTVLAFRDGEVLWRRDGRMGRGLGAKDLRDLGTALKRRP